MKKSAFAPIRKHDRVLTIVIHPLKDGGFSAACPSMPDCHAQGKAMDEAIANVRGVMAHSLVALSPKERAALPKEQSIRVMRVQRMDDLADWSGKRSV